MEIILTVFFTLLGISIGSFLNVVIDRLPAGRSLVNPPSHCDACQRRLSPRELVPIISYLWLRGRCAHCGARISRRVLLVEVLSGVLFFLAFWRFGLSPEFAITALWGCVFLVIIFIDWEQQLILNRLTYPAAIMALAILAADSVLPEWGLLAGLRPFWPQASILSGLFAGAIGLVFFLIVFLINPRGMGMGDIKLAALIGLAVGFPLVIIGLFVGIFIGGLVAVVLLLLKKKGRKDAIPYGTFLAIGPMVALLWGREILQWYISLF